MFKCVWQFKRSILEHSALKHLQFAQGSVLLFLAGQLHDLINLLHHSSARQAYNGLIAKFSIGWSAIHLLAVDPAAAKP